MAPPSVSNFRADSLALPQKNCHRLPRPINRPQPLQKPRRPAIEAANLENTVTRKAHLLLVDDDANTLASLSRAFRLAGHEATVCDNASRAVELLRTEKFDLIFSDVVMPGKDGLSLLEDLKVQGISTPVVM